MRGVSTWKITSPQRSRLPEQVMARQEAGTRPVPRTVLVCCSSLIATGPTTKQIFAESAGSDLVRNLQPLLYAQSRSCRQNGVDRPSATATAVGMQQLQLPQKCTPASFALLADARVAVRPVALPPPRCTSC